MDGLFAFILAGFALAGSPGPATLSLAAAGAAFGAWRSLAYMVGQIIGLIGVMAVTASGLVGLLLAVPGATPIVLAIAALYFVYLAFRIATAPPLTADVEQRREPTFLAGTILSLLNPKGYAAMAAMFSGFVLIKDRIAFDIAMKIAVLVVIVVAVDIAWLLAGAALTRFFREPRANRIVNVGFAVLLIASVAAALLV
jgi:threonine/homoserine/homoserine lactone efflux protein